MPTSPKFLLFVAVVVAQLGGALYMPVRGALIRAQGTPVSLELAPVDPYDILTGYCVDLGYRASLLETYTARTFSPNRGQTVYVTLSKGKDAAWEPVSLDKARPHRTGPGHVVMKGVYDTRDGVTAIWFGIEKLYIPEAKREELSGSLTRLQTNIGRIPAQSARADVMVGQRGDASLVRLHVAGDVYE